MIHQQTRIAFLALVGLITISCGTGCDSDRPSLIPVRGKVTLDGEPMPSGGTIYFYPVGETEGGPTLPGTAYFDVDGTYSARTFEPGDGLAPGKYDVALKCFSEMPRMDGKKFEKVLPAKYGDRSSSGLSVDVKPDQSVVEVDFPLQK